MKKIFFFIIFFLNFSSLNAEQKIYFLDIDFVLNNTNSGINIIEKLKKINDENISQLKKNEEDIKKLEKEISQKKNVISEQELSLKIDNLKSKVKFYKSDKDQKVKDFNKLRDQELKKFFNKITPLIEDFMEINSIKIILDKKNIFIANSNYDITQKLTDYLNSKN